MPKPIKRKIAPALSVLICIIIISLYLINRVIIPFLEKNKTADAVPVSGKCSVTFIDVGQGDCNLIQCGGKTVLIDAGENDMGNRVVLKLKALGIESLDYVIGTHAHSDHIGGLDVVLNNIETRHIILSDLPDKMIPDTKTYTDLLDAIESNNVDLIISEVGKQIDLGDGKLEILAPVADKYTDQNNFSIVTKFTYGGISFLFEGDAETKAETDILNSGADVKADVIKVGHHGSDTSSSERYIKAVSPKYAVVEVGVGNKYGHPSSKTLNALENMNVEIFRTDVSGDITAECDGKTVKFSTEK